MFFINYAGSQRRSTCIEGHNQRSFKYTGDSGNENVKRKGNCDTGLQV